MPQAEGGNEGAGREVEEAEATVLEAGAESGGTGAEQEPPGGGTEENTEDERKGGGRGVRVTEEAEAGKESEKREDGDGIREGKDESGEIRGGEGGGGRSVGGGGGRGGAHDRDTEVDQKKTADELQRALIGEEKVGDGGEAEGGDDAVERVGGGGTETGNKSGEAAGGERAADAEQADRADWGGDGEADKETLEEGGHGAREEDGEREKGATVGGEGLAEKWGAERYSECEVERIFGCGRGAADVVGKRRSCARPSQEINK